MIKLTLKKIALVVDALLIGNDLEVKNICTDTRKNEIKDSLFLAIKGIKINSHFLCYEAIKMGALSLLVDFVFPTVIPQLVVYDTKVALFKIARWIRLNSKSKILAITGSTGKTSVKEITANILSKKSSTLYTLNNFNNEIGVALTLLKLNNFNYKYTILELGVDKINDICNLGKMVCPDVALVTNISVSHLKGFKTFFNVLNEKYKIYSYINYNGIAIINIDNVYLNFFRKYIYVNKILFFSFYKKFGVNVFISNLKLTVYGSYFNLNINGKKNKIFLKLLGFHNILNILASSTLAVSVNISIKKIILGIEDCIPIKGRLYPFYLSKNKILLDDTYNSNPRSLYYSLCFLKYCPGYKILVVGDMAELYNMSIYYHIKIGILIRKMCINKVLSIGNYSFLISKYSLLGEHFINFYDLVKNLKKNLFIQSNITILLKGSRYLKMEKIIDYL